MRIDRFFISCLMVGFFPVAASAQLQATAIFGEDSTLLPVPTVTYPVLTTTTQTVLAPEPLPLPTMYVPSMESTSTVVTFATTTALDTSTSSAMVGSIMTISNQITAPASSLRPWEIPTVSASAVSSTTAIPLFLQHVYEAQQQLLDLKPLKHSSKTKPDQWGEISVAVLKKNGQIEIMTLKRKKVALKVNGEGIPQNLAAAYGADIIFSSTDMDILAVRYPVFRKTSGGFYSAEEIVYSPYFSSIHANADIVAYGQEYYRQLVSDLFSDLNRRGVRSRAFPEKMLTQVVDEVMAKSIMAIEHADEVSLKTQSSRALDRFYATIALNRDRSYGYALSPAGAAGSAQFMPKTYASLVSIRRDSGIDASFASGTRSLRNSILAQMLYLDLTLRDMPIDVREGYFLYPKESREYLVASYNGGIGRVRPLISYWQEVSGISESQFGLSKRKAALAVKVQQYKTVLASSEVSSGLKITYQRDLKEYTELLSALQKRTIKPPSQLRKETVGYLRKYRMAQPLFQQRMYGDVI